MAQCNSAQAGRRLPSAMPVDRLLTSHGRPPPGQLPLSAGAQDTCTTTKTYHHPHSIQREGDANEPQVRTCDNRVESCPRSSLGTPRGWAFMDTMGRIRRGQLRAGRHACTARARSSTSYPHRPPYLHRNNPRLRTWPKVFLRLRRHPPFKTYRAEVTLTAIDSGTLIDWRSRFTPKYPLTGALLRVVMTRVLTDISNRLAAAAAELPPSTPPLPKP